MCQMLDAKTPKIVYYQIWRSLLLAVLRTDIIVKKDVICLLELPN